MQPRVLKEEVLGEGEFQALTLLTYRDARGRTRTWECCKRKGARGAVLVVAVTREGELLLARQFRPPVDAYVLELPAGLVDREEESPEEVAARELAEETGYRAGRLVLLAQGPVSPGMTSEYIWVYLATDLAPGAPQPDDGEQIELLRVPLARVEEELATRQGRGELVDPKIPGFTYLGRAVMGRTGAGG